MCRSYTTPLLVSLLLAGSLAAQDQRDGALSDEEVAALSARWKLVPTELQLL